MNEAFYAGLAAEPNAKLRRVASFVPHAPSIGAYHEEVVRSILRPLVPARFSFRNGFIYAKGEGASHQADILPIDENVSGAYYFREGDFAIVDHRAVVAIVEIKTRLTKATFLQAVEGLASFTRIRRPPHHPASFIFAFESAPFSPRVLGEWFKASEVPDDVLYYPTAIFALDRGLTFLHKQGGEYGHSVVLGEKARSVKQRSLSFFLQILRKHLMRHTGEVTNPFEDALLDGLTLSRQALRFGKGIVEAPAA